MANLHYCSYNDYMVRYDLDTHTFAILYCGEVCIQNVGIDSFFWKSEPCITINDYTSTEIKRSDTLDSHKMSVVMHSEREGLPTVIFCFTTDRHGVTLETLNSDRSLSIKMHGELLWGSAGDAFAVNLESGSDFRAAIGPAASVIDNAIYNRKNDSALCIRDCPNLRLRYDFTIEKYLFYIDTFKRGFATKIKFCVKEHILATKYAIDFAPLKKRSSYMVPPSGWMTWYSVGFNASQETVLRNVEFQEKYLKPYGANTIWVDWEWCHKQHESLRNDGVDTFNPDTKKYPNGLGYMAEQIKKSGFTPALWIGFTNDLSVNEFEKEHPEIRLCEESSWCGTYFYDISHPVYLNEFLPKAIGKVKEWGYETVKFDTLPICIEMHEKYHDRMYDPSLTTKAAYRGMIGKMREILGDDTYVLSCSAINDEHVLWGAGIFDAARIGNDIFKWREFLTQCIEKAERMYPLHNIVLYNDPDNVILREQFNTIDEAISRITFVSLLGMPITFGDDLPDLGVERVSLLQRALPVQDVHPMSLGRVSGGEVQIVNLSIALPQECYNVVQLLNTTDGFCEKTLDFYADLHLETDDYYVYNYFRKEFLGVCSNRISISLEPHSSAVLSIRPKLSYPQIISTSRHITQGAAEIKAMNWSEKDSALYFCSELPAGDTYTVTVAVPEGYCYRDSNFTFAECTDTLAVLSVTPETSGKCEFTVQFEKA